MMRHWGVVPILASLAGCVSYGPCDLPASRFPVPIFEVLELKGPASAPIRVRYADAGADGFRIRLENDDAAPWAVDLEQSSVTSFSGKPESGCDGRISIGVFEEKTIEFSYASDDRAALEAAPKGLVGKTTRLAVALVSAGRTRSDNVILTARLVRIEDHVAERM